jgi:hypothetical protein
VKLQQDDNSAFLDAGIQFVGPIETYPEDKYTAIMDVCLHATFHATKAAIPHMLRAGWGRIINTVSHILSFSCESEDTCTVSVGGADVLFVSGRSIANSNASQLRR